MLLLLTLQLLLWQVVEEERSSVKMQPRFAGCLNYSGCVYCYCRATAVGDDVVVAVAGQTVPVAVVAVVVAVAVN